MTKSEAIRLFGTTQADLAAAIGVTRSAISQWGESLRLEQQDRVIGAAVRLGLWHATDAAAIGESDEPREAA